MIIEDILARHGMGKKRLKRSEIIDFNHTHTKSDVTDFNHTHFKSEITDFAHTHTKSDVTDFTHTHTKNEITDFPSSLPADGGNADTVDNKHANDTASNIALYDANRRVYDSNRINGVRITVSSTAPTSPDINDIWIEI